MKSYLHSNVAGPEPFSVSMLEDLVNFLNFQKEFVEESLKQKNGETFLHPAWVTALEVCGISPLKLMEKMPNKTLAVLKNAVATAHKESLDEVVSGNKVLVDVLMAAGWLRQPAQNLAQRTRKASFIVNTILSSVPKTREFFIREASRKKTTTPSHQDSGLVSVIVIKVSADGNNIKKFTCSKCSAEKSTSVCVHSLSLLLGNTGMSSHEYVKLALFDRSSANSDALKGIDSNITYARGEGNKRLKNVSMLIAL